MSVLHYSLSIEIPGNGRYRIPRKFFTEFEAKLYAQGVEDHRLHVAFRKRMKGVEREISGPLRQTLGLAGEDVEKPDSRYHHPGRGKWVDDRNQVDLAWRKQGGGIVASRSNVDYTIELLDGPVDVPLLGKVSD